MIRVNVSSDYIIYCLGVIECHVIIILASERLGSI